MATSKPSASTGSNRSRASSAASSIATAGLAPQGHPLSRRHYRVATAAIESFVDLLEHCVRVLIPGALVYARPRIGKTQAIDYLSLHLAKHRPDILVLRMSCEHHRSDFEGPFFTALLSATGARQPFPKSTSDKRFALLCRITEQVQARAGHIVVLMCDEAQRLSRHGLEWLRDVHDQLAHHGIHLITFLVGQPQLLEQKAKYQLSGDEQIVARFMIEQLHFRGIARAEDAATCLSSYDISRYPEDGGPTFTQFFYPQAFGGGFRLAHHAHELWAGFVHAHARSQLPGVVEVPMDYFTRAVEALLLNGPQWDMLGFEPTLAHWERAIKDSGYVASRQTVRESTQSA